MAHLSDDVPLDRVALVVGEGDLASTAEQHRACFDSDAFGEVNVLRVMYADEPVSLFEWRREYGTRPYYGSIVVAADPDAVENDSAPREDVAALVSNRNLSRLGGTITNGVESMAENNDRPVHLCFTWVDTMVELAGERDTFQFLRLLIEMIEETDECGAHFHFDPAGASKQQRLTVEQLFEVVTDLRRRHDRSRNTTGASSEFQH